MNDREQTVELIRNTNTVIRQQQLGAATSQIQYVSKGHCLVIGEPAQALELATSLSATGLTIVHVDETANKTEKRLTDAGVAVFTVPALSLSGYLGAFSAIAESPDNDPQKKLDLGVSVYLESGLFDLVLDLSAEAVLPMRLAPFGYIHARDHEHAEAAVEELSGMVGEFEKPRYFNYNESICAHSRSELNGCQRCLDVCTTGAIVSSGEGVTIDPFLCQGCGSCATVCPSGAMSYAYPRPSDAIERTRRSLEDNEADTILLHTEAHQSVVDAASLDATVLPLLVEEVSAFGADYWLSMLAGRAWRIFVVTDASADDPNRLALEGQIEWVHQLLAGLAIDEQPVRLISSADLSSADLAEKIQPADKINSKLAQLPVQDFATHDDKRQTIRLALDALSENLEPLTQSSNLPPGAPFGRINVDTTACTLCMACVSTCPAKALLDGQDTPALRLVEANCLQCGLCEKACPESAISLESRYTWDSLTARRIETLHDEKPFHCIVCHTAFTTQAMIDTMTEKLAGHWMFQDEKAVRRLRLCGDCRVRDMFEEDSSGIDVHKQNS
ncbi:MAG: 4Fe-4S binding protein [Granulosicoccus sp.]